MFTSQLRNNFNLSLFIWFAQQESMIIADFKSLMSFIIPLFQFD